MAKSELQVRAEAAAERFHKSARSPIVIEFAGVPKAGKTTALNHVQAFLRRCGFRVEVVIERASVCPIRDKKHANFNVWTSCTTLAQVLDRTQTPPREHDPEILILDRGIFDSIWWLCLMERLARIRPNDRKIVEQFLLVDDWRKRISGVVVMTTKPEDALKRERGLLPVEGAHGSIMNPEVLEKTRQIVEETRDRLGDQFRFVTIDTSSKKYLDQLKEVCEDVATHILDWVEEQLQEDILSIPKDKVTSAFGGKQWISASESQILLDSFLSDGEFKPRTEVESDGTRVQALPVVVIRNRSGEVLRLRRKEKTADNPLHQKVVIWAGGHVRKEDGFHGNPLLKCAVREIKEELRLDVDCDKLKLLGSVYAESTTSSSKHAAVVYEWRAETDDVAVALSSAEFFERQGNSLSGSFVSLETLLADEGKGKLPEEWSGYIVRNLLESGGTGQQQLFDKQ